MTIQKTLELILSRLDAIEKRLDGLPTAMDIGSIVATTAARDDLHELQGSVDGLYDLIEDQVKQAALEDIRSSLRRAS